jgi:hypothetical protein
MAGYKNINDFISKQELVSDYSTMINLINNLSIPNDICRQGFNITIIDLELSRAWNCDEAINESLIIRQPLLINGHAGVVLVAS